MYQIQEQVQEHLEEQIPAQQQQDSCSIDHVSYRLLSEQDILRLSVLPVLYQKPFSHGKIKEHGLHDLRLGATTQFDPCQTCHESIETCNGHFGHITFVYPIYHALYFKTLIKILNCLCFSCFRVVIDMDPSMAVPGRAAVAGAKNNVRKAQFDDEIDLESQLDFLCKQSKHKNRCERCKFPKHVIKQSKLDLKISWRQAKTAKTLFATPADEAYAASLMRQ